MSGLVLIVDDDEALSENLAEIVQELGVQTVIARDRQGALAEAAGHDFDVALIDVRLPDGDGLLLLAPLRERSPHLQAVMVTGNASVEGAMAAVRGAVFAYVVKPVGAAELLETTRRALDQAALYRERERLRRELEGSEQRHRELVESVPAFVLAMDAAGKLTAWNSELERVTGYQREEMLGTDGRRFVGEAGRPWDLPLKAGGKRKVRWRQAVAKGRDHKSTTYAVGIDVTDEDEILRRVLRSERLAAVGTLAAGLAHEVRNPLNSAALQLTLLERRLDRGDAPGTVLPIAHIIKSEIDRLDRLVREFLAFAQPRPLEPRPVDVGDLFAAVAGLITPEAESVHVSIAIDVAPGTPAVLGEAERLRQVLLNLTRNAIEAMSDKGGQLRLIARRTGAEVEIAVEDDGPGFGEDLPVFDAFFTTKTHGTGLGLPIVHRIISDHGGTIRVESRAGRTRFTLSLPAAKSPAAP
jgi:signal transduction histidine kinase